MIARTTKISIRRPLVARTTTPTPSLMPATTLLASAYTVHPADSSHHPKHPNQTWPADETRTQDHTTEAHETFEMCTKRPDPPQRSRTRPLLAVNRLMSTRFQPDRGGDRIGSEPAREQAPAATEARLAGM